jgi:hypothetical protein
MPGLPALPNAGDAPMLDREGADELLGSPPAERLMRPPAVGLIAPGVDQLASLIERFELVLVEELVAEPSLEAFDEGVLDRLSGRDVMETNGAMACPQISCRPRRFRSGSARKSMLRTTRRTRNREDLCIGATS